MQMIENFKSNHEICFFTSGSLYIFRNLQNVHKNKPWQEILILSFFYGSWNEIKNSQNMATTISDINAPNFMNKQTLQ